MRRFRIFAYYKICTAPPFIPILTLYSGKPQNPVPSQQFLDSIRGEIIYKMYIVHVWQNNDNVCMCLGDKGVLKLMNQGTWILNKCGKCIRDYNMTGNIYKSGKFIYTFKMFLKFCLRDAFIYSFTVFWVILCLSEGLDWIVLEYLLLASLAKKYNL